MSSCRMLVVGHAAWLDHHVLAVVADAADVSPGERHQAVRDQIEIRLANLFFELFEHGLSFPHSVANGDQLLHHAAQRVTAFAACPKASCSCL